MRSPTGSGKTLAYLAPLVHSLAGTQPRISRADGTHAVVLVPTRELAVQVGGSWVFASCAVGCFIEVLLCWEEIAAATPGMKEHASREALTCPHSLAVTDWSMVPAATAVCARRCLTC